MGPPAGADNGGRSTPTLARCTAVYESSTNKANRAGEKASPRPHNLGRVDRGREKVVLSEEHPSSTLRLSSRRVSAVGVALTAAL